MNNIEKFISCFAGAFIVDLFNALYPELIILSLLMVADYISGILAAKKESLKHPGSKKYGISSQIGIEGIFKKAGYIFTILVAICLDFIVYKFSSEIGITFKGKTFFGVLVTLWIITNELISILENCARMGVKLPHNLEKILKDIQTNITDKTD